MKRRIEISASEHGRVRVFALETELAMEIARSGTPDPLCQELGIDPLQHDDVQIIDLKDIADMGLVAFLDEAYGIDPDEIAPYEEALRALKGTVAILRSGAFGANTVVLQTEGRASLVATLTEPNPAIPPMSPLISATAQGTIAQKGGKTRPSDAAISGRIAMVVLIFLGLFVWFLVWVAG